MRKCCCCDTFQDSFWKGVKTNCVFSQRAKLPVALQQKWHRRRPQHYLSRYARDSEFCLSDTDHARVIKGARQALFRALRNFSCHPLVTTAAKPRRQGRWAFLLPQVALSSPSKSGNFLSSWLLSRRILTMRTRLTAKAQVWVSLFRKSSLSTSLHVTGTGTLRGVDINQEYQLRVTTRSPYLITHISVPHIY